MKIELNIPSRCTAKLPEDLDKEYLIAEEKMDGSRYMLYLGCDPYERQPGNTLLSRRVSVVDEKHVDKTANLPHITTERYVGLEGTVLDGEVQAQDFSKTNSIMNSSPALAISKQKELGLCTYYAFDIVAFRGKDVKHLPLSDRRKLLIEVLKRMANPHIKPLKQISGDLVNYFNEIVERPGGEGIIVKDLRQAYGVGWSKMKKSYDLSCIVTGWKPGKGKYESGIGSIALSVYKDGKLVEVGFASGFVDAIRVDMAANWSKYEGRVVDVYAQEVSKPSAKDPCGRLRHPTYHRFRDDLTKTECTFEKMLADLEAAKTKNRRERE